MTDRNVSGDVSRSKYKIAQKVADEVGISPEALEQIADGVREFDTHQSAEGKSARALEQIAKNTTPPRENPSGWAYEQQRLRRREVAALELLSVVPVATDEDLLKIQAGYIYKRILTRLMEEGPGGAA